MPGSRKDDDNKPLFQLPPPGERGEKDSSGATEGQGAAQGSASSRLGATPSASAASRTNKARARGAGGANPFGHLVEGSQGNLLGMSSRAQRTFFIMIVTCSIFVVIVLFNVFGVWHGAQRSMDEYREAEREQEDEEEETVTPDEAADLFADGEDGTVTDGDDDTRIATNGNGDDPEEAGPTIDEAAEALAEQIGAGLEGASDVRLVVFPPVTDGEILPETQALLAELEMELALAIAGRGRLISASRLARQFGEMGYERSDLADEDVRLLIAERLEATHFIEGELSPRRDGIYRWRMMLTDMSDGMIVGGGRIDLRLPAEADDPAEPTDPAEEDDETDEPDETERDDEEPQTQPETTEEPGVDRPEEVEHTERIRFEEISQHFERPVHIPSAIRDRLGNTNEDVYQRDHADWHGYLLREMRTIDPEMVKERAIGMYGTSPDWFKARAHQEGLVEALGHAYTVEGTVWRVREVATADLGLEEQPIVDGEPVDYVWRGLIVFRYTRFLHERPFQRADYAGVLFTATEVPDWLRQHRVNDETKKPVRVRLTGAMMHLRPDAEHESGLVSDELSSDRPRRAQVHPQLVASSIERLPALTPEIDSELLEMVDDGIPRERRVPPKVAQQHLFYRLKWLDEDALQREFYDRAVRVPTPEDVEHGRLGYHDLMKQPTTYRKEPVVAHIRGQVAQIGEDVRNPVLPYRLRPNPYGIREQWIGAITLLDERGAQQNALFDALQIELWDPHTEEYYVYEGPDADRPSGGSQPASPLRRGDEIEITGYFLWVHRYEAKTGEWREVPRFVVHTVRQLPPRESPTDTLATVFLIFMGISLIVIFVLFRRESRSAASYRNTMAKRTIEREGGLRPRADSMAAHRMKQKLEQTAGAPPGEPPPQASGDGDEPPRQ